MCIDEETKVGRVDVWIARDKSNLHVLTDLPLLRAGKLRQAWKSKGEQVKELARKNKHPFDNTNFPKWHQFCLFCYFYFPCNILYKY